jgi:hypothetical protein
MNLLDLMAPGEDLREKALDRLEGIMALYGSEDEDVQDEALARAISLCGKEWGGYKAGLEELACRKETVGADVEALRLREEADDPGMMIRVARARRSEAGRADVERAAIVARYGSLLAALAPSPIEAMFIGATAHLADPAPDGEAAVDADAWAPLAGWSVPWHPVPDQLAEATAAACSLPTTLADARAECMAWEERRHERDILGEGPGTAALPTACAARHVLVEELWRRGLPPRNAAEFEARLEFWATRGGDDGAGYAVLLGDLRGLGPLAAPSGGESTGDKARRLKAENPSWSLARIGKELGISRQAVHKHLKRG